MGFAYGGFVKLRRFRDRLLFFHGLFFTMRGHLTIKRNHLIMAALEVSLLEACSGICSSQGAWGTDGCPYCRAPCGEITRRRVSTAALIDGF